MSSTAEEVTLDKEECAAEEAIERLSMLLTRADTHMGQIGQKVWVATMQGDSEGRSALQQVWKRVKTAHEELSKRLDAANARRFELRRKAVEAAEAAEAAAEAAADDDPEEDDNDSEAEDDDFDVASTSGGETEDSGDYGYASGDSMCRD